MLTTSAHEAAEFIRNGGIVAFPTETVYGLGANVFDEKAVGKIFSAKNRPPDNPLIAHVRELAQIHELAAEVPPDAAQLIKHFFPGPLTLVLRKVKRVPLLATAGLETIGIRMPKLPLAACFLEACGVPVAAPSANLSGRPSPTTWQAVHEDLDGRIDCILEGEATDIGLESTVVDCTSHRPVLLRTGAVSLESLRTIVPDIVADTGPRDRPRSPGQKHKHYSPRARVIIFRRGNPTHERGDTAFIGLTMPPGFVGTSRTYPSAEEYASGLFEFFRECDRLHVETIYCEAVEETGIGSALMDRIRRAASME